jgi:hypothetical protein
MVVVEEGGGKNLFVVVGLVVGVKGGRRDESHVPPGRPGRHSVSSRHPLSLLTLIFRI